MRFRSGFSAAPVKGRRQQGFSLIEILVTLLILLVGLLGLVGLLIQAQRSQLESYQRVQALVVMNDMVNRMSTNRKVAACYATPVVSGNEVLPYLGTGATISAPECTATPSGMTPAQALEPQALALQSRAVADLTEWSAMLQSNLVNARGCITVQTDPVTGYLIYRVAVVWQGNGRTGAPASTACGQGQYSSDDERRAVVVPLQFPSLSPATAPSGT